MANVIEWKHDYTSAMSIKSATNLFCTTMTSFLTGIFLSEASYQMLYGPATERLRRIVCRAILSHSYKHKEHY